MVLKRLFYLNKKKLVVIRFKEKSRVILTPVSNYGLRKKKNLKVNSETAFNNDQFKTDESVR